MNRRGFLSSILALAAAPAIVRADSLMRVIPIRTVILPAAAETPLTGEAALIAVIRKVWEAGGEPDVIRCSSQFAQQIHGWFSGAAIQFAEAGSRRIIQPVSVYVSDYGCSKVIVEREIPHDFIVESPGGYAQPRLRS